MMRSPYICRVLSVQFISDKCLHPYNPHPCRDAGLFCHSRASLFYPSQAFSSLKTHSVPLMTFSVILEFILVFYLENRQAGTDKCFQPVFPRVLKVHEGGLQPLPESGGRDGGGAQRDLDTPQLLFQWEPLPFELSYKLEFLRWIGFRGGSTSLKKLSGISYCARSNCSVQIKPLWNLALYMTDS